ncbi:GH12776 [Drosophila grimshawi]|uniref:GH12776 n=1 Tax=Drosophila grimshawi TaxID=7222 RepID=B4JL25_DROGR|nr:GH12776 [Drosophila grimshawi]
MPILPRDKENGENQQPITTGLPMKAVFAWSTKKVYDFVEQYCPQYADIFTDNKIDGTALMVLSRGDIINRFGLELGKALDIYDIVVGLQNSTNDFTLAWYD